MKRMTSHNDKSAPVEKPREIGAYRLGELLGEGGMGCVYEAEEILTGRTVALKLMRHELAQSSEARRLFLREMELLSCLEHPRVVRSLACFDHEGQLAGRQRVVGTGGAHGSRAGGFQWGQTLFEALTYYLERLQWPAEDAPGGAGRAESRGPRSRCRRRRQRQRQRQRRG